MRTFLKIIFFIFFGSNIAFGQITVRLFNYRPTGEFGFVMKPLYSAEIGWQNPFYKSRFRTGFSLTYLKMKPRMDVFPVSGVLTDGSGTRVLPGTESFQKYNIGLLIVDEDFAFVQQKKFNIFIGTGIMIGAASVNYTNQVQSVINETYQGGGILGGFRFRLGAEYIINDYIAISIIANRNVFLVSDPGAINWANDYGIGVRYTFNAKSL